jgi:GTP cyclohydrolase IA
MLAVSERCGAPLSEEELRREDVRDAYRTILSAAEPETWHRDGLVETPVRAANALEELTAGYGVDVAALLKTFDSNGYDEMVAQTAIPFYSLCEHHLLPFHGVAHIAYIPTGRIVGLSKLARLTDAFARRLQVQERLTQEIADALEKHLKAKGVMVIVEAEHLCMAMRGVERPGAITKTSAVRGAMKKKPEARAEAQALLTKETR